MEDLKFVKGIVKREIIRIIISGIFIDENILIVNNFICCILKDRFEFVLIFVDVLIGEMYFCFFEEDF